MFRITPETPDDSYEVEMLYDLAFAPGRTALSSYRLRDGVAPVAGLSCVARDEYDALVGAIRYWPVRVGEAGVPALLLGPVAVHPTRQGEGLGALLIGYSLDRATETGWERVLLVGDYPYYRRFGFEKVEVEFPPPTNPDRVLGRELAPGALAGLRGRVRRWTEA
ncbi:N-acetyltransferase [Halovulum dunhuangense]|uniref:N-acetyltransferase n=1 Tax=Halovulum dunhuangense TaxID=1505036 RepID=A0A849L0F8_9RHOB|nr:N-acetyltransferase [Halovulum dunhuangense]NNU79739.1 N-acetyltransferase [Halovulum dunhuangense]